MELVEALEELDDPEEPDELDELEDAPVDELLVEDPESVFAVLAAPSFFAPSFLAPLSRESVR